MSQCLHLPLMPTRQELEAQIKALQQQLAAAPEVSASGSSAAIAGPICARVMIPFGPGDLPMIISSRSATGWVITTDPVALHLNS